MSAAAAAAPHDAPERAIAALARALGAGDLALAMSHLAPDARLLTPDQTVLEGRGAIGELLAQLAAGRPDVRVRVGRVLRAGDLALVEADWIALFSVPGAEPHAQDWRCSIVLRCALGRWRLHILAPWELTSRAEQDPA